MNDPSPEASDLVLVLSCPDRVGIVRAVAVFLADRDCGIVDSQQFGDADSGRFFMRVHVSAPSPWTAETLAHEFVPVGEAYAMDWQLHDIRVPGRVLVMVSRQGHCLNDLLYRQSSGALHCEIPVVVSNHRDFEELVTRSGSRFEHVPVDPQTKPAAEQRLLDLVEEHRVDVVVLARYMQVLSDDLCARIPVPVINIHHSFLPSFKGARPYHQAFERGVKLIGATAHYVTSDLDEGPIIEQEVARVDHAHTPERLAAVGRDVECLALARAVRWHLDHRVLRNAGRTVVLV